MEEIKVGEYVRTKQGKIRQVQTIHSGERITAVTKETLINGKIKIPDVLKHSPNIIDLIEVGDYVNGNKINCFNIFNNISGEQCLNINYIYTNSLIIPIKDIKSIVTREMFEKMIYKVGD